MQVLETTRQDKERWDAFVDAEGGSFFQYYDWKTIYEVQPWQYLPLLLEDNTHGIMGIFPCVKIKEFLYSRLVSLPDGASGGFLVKKSLTQLDQHQAVQMFLQYIKENVAKDCSLLYLKENLTMQDAGCGRPTDLLVKNGFTFRGYSDEKLPCTYRLVLSSSFEYDIWTGLWNKYLRNHVRKSQKLGVTVMQDTHNQYQEEVISMIEGIYRNFHETPPSREEITLRLTTFKGKTKVWVAVLNGTPIASLLCYYTPSSVCYASKLGYKNPAREYYATVQLFSEAIWDACENGYRYFEFGTTETATLARWKEQFKPVKIPMRIYEKKYSTVRTVFDKTPSVIRWTLKNKEYVWKNRRRLVHKIIG